MNTFFMVPILIVGCVILPAGTAHALQAHGAPEGLYVHQLAHLFFTICMGSFAWRIYSTRLREYRGWRLLTAGAVLLVFWNLWAFAGHFVTLCIPEERFSQPAGRLIPSLRIDSWLDALYYVLKMDHFLCVPALLCFYLGLRAMMSMFPERAPRRKKSTS